MGASKGLLVLCSLYSVEHQRTVLLYVEYSQTHTHTPLTRGKVNQLYSVVAEPGLTFKLGASPQSHALPVHGGQVGALQRPSDIRISPELQNTITSRGRASCMYCTYNVYMYTALYILKAHFFLPVYFIAVSV